MPGLKRYVLDADVGGVTGFGGLRSVSLGTVVVVLAVAFAAGALRHRFGAGEAAPSVDKATWVAHNREMFASLRRYPTARFYLAKSWGIPDRIVHSPADAGPPYSGYVTELRYKLGTPSAGVAIGDFYARQLASWTRNPVGSCEWSFTSPEGASLTVDACRGTASITAEYVVDVNYDQVWSIAQAQGHG